MDAYFFEIVGRVSVGFIVGWAAFRVWQWCWREYQRRS